MAHDTKTLLRDGSGITPVPQFFNPTADDFRPLTGVDLGNGRYGADGLIWGKTSGGVYVPVKCNADGAVVTELSGSDVATEAKQDALNALIGEAQASPTANTLLARIKNIEDKIDAITAGITPAVTQLSGSKMELYGVAIEDRPAANTVAKGATFTIVDKNLDQNWVSDGTNWVEV